MLRFFLKKYIQMMSCSKEDVQEYVRKNFNKSSRNVHDLAEEGQFIEEYVKIGFSRGIDILRSIEYFSEKSPFLPEQYKALETIIYKKIREKRKLELSWLEKTDCDRLEIAFKDLAKKKIVALHNAGYTNSESLSLIYEKFKKSTQGYCFYSFQDIQLCLKNNVLCLGFGPYFDGKNSYETVAMIIIEALKDAGLNSEWSGLDNQKIILPNFKWQKRISPRKFA